MDQEDGLISFTKQENLIRSCIQLGNALGDVTAENEMKDLLTEFVTIKSEHLRCLQALANMRKPQEEQENVQDLFQEALSNVPGPDERASHGSGSSGQDDEDEQDSMGERSFMVSQVEGIPIDPLTKMKIKSPARNSVCHHVYEHNIIISYLKQCMKAQKKKKVKCPYIGCMNNDVRMEHIVMDEKLMRKIAAMQSEEDDSNADASIVSI